MSDVAPEIGWQVLDPEGNVVDSGPITIAQFAGDPFDFLPPATS
jgi:hypothetical protein